MSDNKAATNYDTGRLWALMHREKGWTISKLAAAAGCSRVHLGKVLGGERPFVRPLAEKLARALKVELVALEATESFTDEEYELVRGFRRLPPGRRRDVLVDVILLAAAAERGRLPDSNTAGEPRQVIAHDVDLRQASGRRSVERASRKARKLREREAKRELK